MKLNIIFDIDSCIAHAIQYNATEKINEIEKKLGKEFTKNSILTAYEYPHWIFPGFYALWEWLHLQGATITVFSTGIKERNVELVKKLAKRSFQNIKEEERPKIEVFSREDTFDTERIYRRNNDKYQSCWFGNLKKKLSEVVVSEEDLPYSLLVDDDRSYVAANEERNLLYVSSDSYFYSEHLLNRNSHFQAFHKAYYICGLLQKIIAIANEKKMNPMMAAEYVQVTMEGEQIGRDFYFPSRNRMEYYIDGLKTLQTIDSSLKFYFEPENS